MTRLRPHYEFDILSVVDALWPNMSGCFLSLRIWYQVKVINERLAWRVKIQQHPAPSPQWPEAEKMHEPEVVKRGRGFAEIGRVMISEKCLCLFQSTHGLKISVEQKQKRKLLEIIKLPSDQSQTLMAVEGGLVTKAEVLPLEQVQSGHAAHPRRDAARANFLQFPLYGDRVSQGYYMTKLWLGTPPREYKVLIDTGSDITWLSCKTNLTGQLQLTRYDPDNSSTAEIISCKHPACHTVLPSDGVCQDSRNPCQYLINYEDKTSTNGFYVVDSFPLMMNDKRNGRIDSTAKFIFGCSTFRSLTNDADGILGLGIQGASMVIQLYAQGKVPRVFSHCLSGKMHGGGFLIFGEVELPDISYSHYDPSRLHYSLSLESISVGGKTLPINPGLFAQSSYRGTIVDSGTTNGVLVAEAFDRLLSFISKNISPSVVYTFDNFGYPCFTNDSLSFRDLFPLIHFNFVDGESMALHPTEYLLEEGYSPGFTCIGFGRSEDFTILGDLFLKDKIIIYDLERQMIGWRIYDCSVVPEVGFYPPSGPKSKAFISADLIPTPHRMVAAVFLHLMFIYS